MHTTHVVSSIISTMIYTAGEEGVVTVMAQWWAILQTQEGPNIGLGYAHICAVLTTNDDDDTNHQRKLLCWGFNSEGQLSDGSATSDRSRTTNTVIDSITGSTTEDMMSIALGGYHTCALTDNKRKLFCWGSNNNSQLGDGTIIDHRATPTQIMIPLLRIKVKHSHTTE